MATYTLTPAQLKGAGIYNSFEIPAGGGSLFSSTYSFVFDGTDDYIDCGTLLKTYLELGDSFSFSVWFKIDVGGTEQSLVDNLGGTNLGVQLRATSANRVRLIIVNNGFTYIYRDSSVLNTTTWYHVCGTYDGSNTLAGINIYIDGDLDNSTGGGQNTITTITSPESFTIGRGGYFSGNIDEVAVFNIELSASNVTTIYNSGVPNDLSSLSPLSWWRMGEAATFDGIRDWDLVDQGSGGNNATSQNMAEDQRVTDVPS